MNHFFLKVILLYGTNLSMDHTNIDHALLAVERMLERDPMDWEAWSAKADLMYSARMYDNAIRCCNRSLELNPGNAFTWNTKGDSLKKLGNRKDAVNCYGKAKQLEPCLNRLII